MVEKLFASLTNQGKAAVSSNQMMARTVVIVLLLVGVIIGFLEYFRRVWRDDFELKTPGNGAIVFHSTFSNGFRKVVFLVPASQCWVNTYLDFEPGETVDFKTSGQVHLALNQIKQEELPKISWSRPIGSPFIRTSLAGDRSQFLLTQDYLEKESAPQIGNLVGYFQAIDIDADPGKLLPRPVGKAGNTVFSIRESASVPNQTGRKARLWLSINDVVLEDSDKAKLAYLGDSTEFVNQELAGYPVVSPAQKKLAVAEWQKHKANWDSIRLNKQWDLYYNDNIGTYLVFIDKK